MAHFGHRASRVSNPFGRGNPALAVPAIRPHVRAGHRLARRL